MSSSDTPDTSYSPETFDLLDYKFFSPVNAPSGSSPKPRTKLASVPGETSSEAFPKFPTLFELATTAPEPPVKRNPPGIYEQYLSKDPSHIIQDARTTPERYDARALSLLEDIYEGRRKWETLTPAEKGQLDEATLEFFSPGKKIETSSLAPSSSTPSSRTPHVAAATPPKPVLGPVLDAFWWAQ